MNTPHDDLTRSLEREADQFARRGGTTLEIGQVLDRAGEIRRGRRMRATMVMAACVLAIAVPTVLVAVNRDTTHEPTPAPAPKVDTSPLTLGDLKTGASPKTGWFQGEIWHGADGRESQVTQGPKARVTDVARIGDAFLFATSDQTGQRANLVPPASDEAGTVQSWPMEGGFAVSGGGHVAAFVQPDGTPIVVQDSGRTTYAMPKIPRGSGFDAVAVTGEDCKESAANEGCTVWVTTSGQKPENWVSTSHGFADNAPGDFRAVADVNNGGRVAGMTSLGDADSCSAVKDSDGKELWSTCTHQFESFSPDGKLLSAYPAYFDGAGSSEVAVLDASDGSMLVDLHTVRDAVVYQVTWEDDSHLLAAVGEGTRAAVLRIGLDGSREYAVAPETAEPYLSPFHLPTS
jgi:hypothetical protein